MNFRSLIYRFNDRFLIICRHFLDTSIDYELDLRSETENDRNKGIPTANSVTFSTNASIIVKIVVVVVILQAKAKIKNNIFINDEFVIYEILHILSLI